MPSFFGKAVAELSGDVAGDWGYNVCNLSSVDAGRKGAESLGEFSLDGYGVATLDGKFVS